MRKISMLFLAAAVTLSACKPEFKKGDDGVEYMITVSYTHLDVYKRQAMHGVLANGSSI